MSTTTTKKPKSNRQTRPRPRVDALDSRNALIRSAHKHFGAQGYQAASVHDIARDANVNVSLVNYHFGGKEGLFRACFEEAGLARLEIAERILTTIPNSIDEVRVRLSMFVEEMLIDGIRNPEVCAIIHRELTAEFDILGDVFKKTFLRTFDLLSAFISTARDKKILAPWTDPNLSAVQIVGSVMHTIRTDVIRSRLFKKSITDTNTRHATRDYIVRTHLDGIWNRSQK